MIKLFNVYYSKRTLVLIGCESLLVSGTFLLTALLQMGSSAANFVLLYENGWLKIMGITTLTLLLNYYFDLYEPRRISETWQVYFRLLLVMSLLSFALAGLLYVSPRLDFGGSVAMLGVSALAVMLILWRFTYQWASSLALFSERVYVLGHGQQARNVVGILSANRSSGMRLIGWSGDTDASGNSTAYSDALTPFCSPRSRIDRVIVAVEDRRESLPIKQLLDLRLYGVEVENCTALIERLSGRVALDGLYPSTLIFADGFRLRAAQQFFRRTLSFMVALVALTICLPFLPLIILAVRLSSPGPVLFRQTRVGRLGQPFTVYKFRTMRQDAEKNGAVWAKRNDPRVTRLGRFMRKTRLDEIPQLWNVLRGDMAFVGPRPERPEFVEWLSREIPFYDLRHMIPPGLTGWAQVRFQYGATLEETKKKLEYDLYYIKHQSVGLDLLVMFETIKTIVLRRGAQ